MHRRKSVPSTNKDRKIKKNQSRAGFVCLSQSRNPCWQKRVYVDLKPTAVLTARLPLRSRIVYIPIWAPPLRSCVLLIHPRSSAGKEEKKEKERIGWGVTVLLRCAREARCFRKDEREIIFYHRVNDRRSTLLSLARNITKIGSTRISIKSSSSFARPFEKHHRCLNREFLQKSRRFPYPGISSYIHREICLIFFSLLFFLSTKFSNFMSFERKKKKRWNIYSAVSAISQEIFSSWLVELL